jgi:hypothetical protein
MVTQEHPRILFRPGDFERLRRRLSRSPFREHFAIVRGTADKYLASGPPAIEVPAGFYATYRAQSPEAVQRHLAVQAPVEANLEAIRNAALVFRLTGDRRYRDLALAAIGNLAGIDPVETNYRVTHCFCHLIPALSYGLDWLWDEMDPSGRACVIESLRERTSDFYPLSLESALDSPLDSHAWLYGVVGMAFASLALFHHVPEAEGWLETLLAFLEYAFPGFGADDGGWGQGIGYAADVEIQLVLHLVHVGTGIDVLATPWVRNNGRVRLYFQPPYGSCPTFGDASYLRRPGLQKQVMEIYAMTTRNPYYQWYADQIEAPYFGGGYFFSHEYFLSHFLNWRRPRARPPADLPQAIHLRDVGWVAMHSHLADGTRHIGLQLKSSHFGSFNHSHADQNSFVLDAFGQPLLIDSGYYPWYGSRHDVLWARQTLAHNALLINGKGQGVWNRAAAGRIAAFEHTEMADYAAGDATAAYQQPSLDAPLELCAAQEGVVRVIRHFVYLRPNVFVLLDDIETRAPASLQFLLHAPNAFQLDPGGRLATVANGPALAQVQFLGTDPLALVQTDQFTAPPEAVVVGNESRGTANQWHLRAEFAATTPCRRLLTVITVRRSGEASPSPAAEAFSVLRTLGVRIGETVVQFRLNPAAVTVTCWLPRAGRGPEELRWAGPPTA